MSCKFHLALFLSLCFITLDAQEGCFGVAIYSGFAEHGFYISHDDNSLIKGHQKKYAWSPGLNESGCLSIGLNYNYKHSRFESNFTFYPSISIDEPLNFNIGMGGFRFSQSFRVVPFAVSFLTYKNLNKNKDRISLNPGIGVAYYNLSFYNLKPSRSLAFVSVNPNALTYEREEIVHNKSNYQVIGALELAIRVGTYTYLSFKSQYHLSLLKMYERSYTYRYNQDQVKDHKASVLYYGNHYNFNFGIRWRFNAVDRFNYIE